MYFGDSAENKNLIKRLESAVKSGRISHAYIFEGSGCVDKESFAVSFAKGILCPENRGDNCGACGICHKIDSGNHEDIVHIEARGGSIKDADITELQEKLKSKPFGDRHIAVIRDCDTMTLRAQNRLLKTLEEPPGDSVLILLSENMENLTQTIRSRCVKYRINHFGSEGYDFMMDKAEKVAGMVFEGRPFYELKKEAEDVSESAEEASAFLDGLQVVFRNMLTDGIGGISKYRDSDLVRNIYAVEAARRQIKSGVSRAYAIKDLLIKIGG